MSSEYIKQHGSQLVTLGYRVVPIRAGYKAPAVSSWQHLHASAQDVAHWASENPKGGVGVITENTPAIDIDCLDKDVVYKLVKWIENNIGHAPIRIGRKPKALMVFQCDEPFGKIRSNEYVDCIGNKNAVEVLAKGQQFVAYATHPDTGKPYTWPKKQLTDTPREDLPTLTREQAQAFVEYFESIVPDDWELSRRGVSAAISDEDDLLTLRPKLGKSVEELATWLETIDPDCGHDEWVKVGMALHHETGGSPEGLELWDGWSAKSGKYVEGECRKRWRSFGRNDHVAPVTAQYLERQAKKVERKEKQKGLVDQLLRDLVLVQVSGSARVIREDVIQDGFDLYGVTDLEKEYANQCIPIEVEKKNGDIVEEKVNPIKLWLTNPERRTARGLVFLPDGQKQGYYNLWRGWSCEPEEGDVAPFVDWAFDIIADRNEAHFNWIMGWAAQMVQQPMTKIGVAMVLRGEKGTGKSKLGELFGKLFEPHWKVVSKPEQIVGNFNRHLEDCLLLQAEEAFWAGSKSAEGALKDLVTNERIMIERKGVDSYMAPNFTRILMTSNEDWVVPATADERRWAVFDVASRRKQDYDFYAGLQRWYDRGGKKAVLHYLKTFDLSKVSVRQAPKTKPLLEQQLRGMDCVTRWLYECLWSGEIRDARSGSVLEFGETAANKVVVFDSYSNSQQTKWERKSDQQFWVLLAKRFGDLFPNSRQKMMAGSRQRVCDILPLAEARKLFERETQLSVDWPDPIRQEEVV